MAAKKTKSADEKFDCVDFDLFAALDALDRKDYGYYSRLTEEQARKFTPYMLLHWLSSVKGTGLMPAYYVLSVDAQANRHMFNEHVQHHPELQWLMLCSASPGAGKQWHQWIPHLGGNVVNLRDAAKPADVQNYLSKVYPGADGGDIKAAAEEWVKVQNHRVKLAKLLPALKLSDIEVLSAIVDSGDLEEYEKLSGN